MTVPIRRPIFETLYPTPEAFDEAMKRFAALSAPPGSVGEPTARGFTGPARGQLPDAAVTVRSTRQFGSQLLSASGVRILSESDGHIDTLLLSVAKGTDSLVPPQTPPPPLVDPIHLRHHESLFAHFGNTIRYLVVLAPEQFPPIQGALATHGISTAQLIASPHFKKSIWVQDAQVTLVDRGGDAILCEGVAFSRFEDSSVADDVAAQVRGVRALQSNLYFQGGNVLGGRDITLIGRDYVWRNATRFGLPTEKDVLDAFAREFGTKVIALGGPFSKQQIELFWKGVMSGAGLQPIFHIDMYVTRTGVVENGREVVFLGRPAAAHAVTGHYSDMTVLDDPLYDSCFDQTAADLAPYFEVRPLPLWPTSGDLGGVNSKRKFYHLTWNNALVETGKARVTLPNYADEKDARTYQVDLNVRRALQSAVEAAWVNLGFKVAFTDGLEDLAWGDGALHCMTKVVSRS